MDAIPVGLVIGAVILFRTKEWLTTTGAEIQRAWLLLITVTVVVTMISTTTRR